MKDGTLGCALRDGCLVVNPRLKSLWICCLMKRCVVLSFVIVNISYNTPPDDFETKRVFERAMAIEFYK